MDSKINCICSALEEISDFFSISEFERFQKHIQSLVNDDDFIEIPVIRPYAAFTEQWYQCKKCSQIWRLVYPDFPFKGLWNIVDEKE